MPEFKGDATGWKRGAGVYSRSYNKVEDGAKSRFWAPYNVTASTPAQQIHRGTSIYDRVTDNGPKRGRLTDDLGVNNADWGASNEVSRGRRPAHRQGSWASKGVGKYYAR
jgi:hypothetical protein